MIKKIATNNFFIIGLLLVSIIVYCFFYERSITGLSEVLSQLGADIKSVVTEGEMDLYISLADIAKSMYVQVPTNFIITLFTIYISSIFILIVIKIEQVARKHDSIKLSFTDIVDCFYISLYVVILNFFIKSIIMLAIGSSVETFSIVYYISYWLVFTVMQGVVFLVFLEKHIQDYISPIIMYFFIIAVELTALIIISMN